MVRRPNKCMIVCDCGQSENGAEGPKLLAEQSRVVSKAVKLYGTRKLCYRKHDHAMRYISGSNESLRRYGHSTLSKMAACRQLGFDVTGNSAIRSADPENPTLLKPDTSTPPTCSRRHGALLCITLIFCYLLTCTFSL